MICLTIGKASSVALRHAGSNQVARRATDILDQGHATAFYLHPVFKVWASGCVPSLVEKRRGGRLLPTG